MDTPISPSADPAHAYRDIFERAAIDSAFLWLLRSIAVDQPHYTASDLAELDERIDAQLDLLMSSLELGWRASEEALAMQEGGEAFTACVIALRSHDVSKIQTAVQSSFAVPAALKGVISALGWMPEDVARPWVERLLMGKDMNHKYLGVAASSVRRHNPGELLTDILQREDCRRHAPLYARALRLVGELRRQDLMPALQSALKAPVPAVAFWATWSAILLGQHTLAGDLQPIVLKSGPYQARAIHLAFRVIPINQGREWISALAQDPSQVRTVITATGVLGDPHAVNWLISKMADPMLARLAGEAFTTITGIDLVKHELTAPAPADQAPVPNDDSNDTNVELDQDEHVPWPDAVKIAALWRQHGQHFLVGRRYFLGKPITPEWLQQCLREATQRQRHAAALELALIDTQHPLYNTRARPPA